MECPARLTIPWSVLFLLAAAVAACSFPALQPEPTLAPSPTPDLPLADEVAFAFLDAWERGDYPAMYSLLSPASQEEYPEDLFTTTYLQVAEEAMIQGVTPRILAVYQPDTHAEAAFLTTFQTAMVGSFEIQNQMMLTFGEGRWSVEWSPALLFPQLSDET